ncbi:hypothetical protein B0T22DRAFT_439653 [Podospora appendiculata]|uniref:BHLH domain-containing protein n=1 Tax=Podospora appendiculata TaxID=314037 RepID=A0AAE0X934_9PEZI|nr:hypothetical protein B0T22DRAFT_439653 [Podospora appendiculata]
MHHPMATNFSACSLSTKGEHSSFPERHLTPRDSDSSVDWPEPVEIPDLQSHWATYSPPQLGALEPQLMTFSPRNWLDQQSQPPVHRAQHTARVAFPQARAPPNNLHLVFSPPLHETAPVNPTGWDMLLLATDHSTASFPWSPTQPAIKIEDDSDLIWSLNDSQEDSQSLPSSWLPAQKFKKRRSVPKVTKPSRQSTAQARHFASLGKQLVRASVPDRLELSKTASAASHSSDLDNPLVTGGTIDLTSDDFSAKLDSKRVAHKLSEKSRRNRLTAAIREIQKLLPQDAESDERPPGSLISKVDVVEMAIGYIKRLKQENAATVKWAEEAEGQLRASHPPTMPHSPHNVEGHLVFEPSSLGHLGGQA